jgi:uncharacterized Zn finger protein
MAAKPTLTIAAIRQLAAPEVFERGEEYYEDGAVLGLVRRGDVLQAEVEGSSYDPYQVQVTLGPSGVVAQSCSCPYDWGGACKHVVAVLLTYLHAPEKVEERPPLATLLAELDRDQLQGLLLTLADRQPALGAAIEAQIDALRTAPDAVPAGRSGPRQRQAAVDVTPYRRQVRAALGSLDRMSRSQAYWHVGSVASEVGTIASQARSFLAGGDGRSALAILEAVTDEYVQGWTDLDDSDGEASGAFYELDQLWTEALLAADLTRKERESWAERFTDWAAELDDYGVEDAFYAAERAAVEGWDEPTLQRILRGEAPSPRAGARPQTPRRAASAADEEASDDGLDDEDTWDDELDGEAPPWADVVLHVEDQDVLTLARLNVLEQQGRLEEYLRLAAAMDQRRRYGTMLVRLGRLAEAVDYGLAALRRTDEALALARALADAGAVAEALRVAERGLTLDGWKAELARWTRDAASAAGDAELALRAARVALRAHLGAAEYAAVRELAGQSWPDLRDEVLADVRQARAQPHGQVEILLTEDLIAEAIAISDAQAHDYHLAALVADAAIATHPAWVMAVGQRQAESIINAGKSQHYDTAARWLTRVRDAARVAGREAEWRAYLDSLLAEHRRKYSLVPRLKQLAG